MQASNKREDSSQFFLKKEIPKKKRVKDYILHILIIIEPIELRASQTQV